MENFTNPPAWLEVISWISLVLAFASAVYILYDIFILGHRQQMWIMEIVYPITALYLGPLTIWFYLKYGRQKKMTRMDHEQGHQESPRWNQVSEGVMHCGAGCSLGDIIGSWIIFAFGITLAGKALYADFLFDFILAWSLGIAFQFFTIVPMRKLGKIEGLWESIKADTFSIIAFQIGLFVGMYIYQEWFFSNPLPKNTASYWFLMQLSMILGFFTGYPVTRWLIKRGTKPAM